ncbi:hypothetical protein BAURA86_01746 [Brevibacterium aurantiacum]|uniref:Uncharacterized protein n=1 Tax=Brevibacterium aurantiacum TaxID=273384 RepID=A0A2H1HTU8_BREAU|nr:hypothetical protein BAUR9175_00458 [Brevibacterium aurantiacum]SMX86577.1 hypothetical protein BAUR920_02102 [Brevibacterium aurantiacum]SMX87458.1 hypothetical protein BAURA86_01746 [Brevibacterium aurantiacum]
MKLSAETLTESAIRATGICISREGVEEWTYDYSFYAYSSPAHQPR